MFRILGEPLVADPGEPEDLGFAWFFVRATRRPRPPIRQCDYYCHSRLHALPETDELATDFTLPANLRAGASCGAGMAEPRAFAPFPRHLTEIP
ncbi:hypothetical protein AMK01_CH01309 [Rhizobium sp. N6212]|nr:hypothetical protein AMK01_CH01309 [Rhizobium sp. N6212]ANK96842.1 hypothetical protein AMK00_CH01311 [Rhizobium sp. N621]ANL02962.1 hypothetical protein AMJ99_CH01379 [Rhizobium esperanzae]ANL09011.1 hypothetical protein AMJ98_CH01300 [Rhizobium sp. N1341]ANL21058.1 hypothetical protein AMJ96_CH01303 [Rhizobium sp. N113]ANM33815.1 hypothetical protein AMK04_CH01381 [Rhizobium sp. N871]ANM39852.1 hypothetical protein AMK03_CH01300 [Rhizobium sp. N741]